MADLNVHTSNLTFLLCIDIAYLPGIMLLIDFKIYVYDLLYDTIYWIVRDR